MRRSDLQLRAPVYQTTRNEYRMVLATMPLPASPMDTKTGLARPGTVARSKRTL
jgi:hypothetical protein